MDVKLTCRFLFLPSILCAGRTSKNIRFASHRLPSSSLPSVSLCLSAASIPPFSQ